MKNIFKITILSLLTALFLQSCTSEECHDDIVSNKDEITTALADKIITTATSVNDYNFYYKNANLDCTYSISASFINPEGNYFGTAWLSVGLTALPQTTIEEEKQRAFDETGIHFTYDDFFIHSINTFNNDINYPEYGIYREEYLDFFENCNYGGQNNPFEDYSIPLSDVNFNCNTSVVYTVGSDLSSYLFSTSVNNTLIYTPLNDGLIAVENQLIIFNNFHNTLYTLDDVRVAQIQYTSPAGIVWPILNKKRMLSYFDDCSFERDINDNDCLNFVYPLQINRANQQIDEIITLENDEDLVATFSTIPNDLNFIFPINLLGADGNLLVIETNEALENALNDSSNYCN